MFKTVEYELDKQINELESQVQLEWERIKEYEKTPKLQFQKPPKAKVSTSPRSDECEIGSSSNSDWTKFHKQSTPRAKSYQSEIGADLWKQLRRVTIPVFNGEKSHYESWKAAFMACVDKAPATPEYKLLQLKQCLSGEALRTIQNLGHSAASYEVAKARLERKFGGQRRKVALHLEQIERLKPMQDENARKLEKIADMLDMVIVNLEEAGRDEELGNGVLYVTVQKKFAESLLVRYHRWIHENQKRESVLALRDWMLQEVEFLTTASETIHGFMSRPDSRRKKNFNQQTYFGRNDKSKSRSKACPKCGGCHGMWNCNKFRELQPWQRWNVAKQFKLCFRCLDQDHIGSSCPATRVCGKEGCQKTHHELLHTTFNLDNFNRSEFEKNRQTPPIKCDQKVVKTSCTATQTETTGEFSEEDNPTNSSTRSHTTRKRQTSEDRHGFIALRTVPVILKNGNREIAVNASLDDASTKTYINTDVAAELGLQGKFQKASVNVLNGQVETFVTMPVEFELKSLDGEVTHHVNAFTTEKVTGDMEVVDWNKFAKRWDHLKNINFPKIHQKSTVDLLIGVDHADLLYSKQEIRGDEGEPIARLTPLGWTCIGVPSKDILHNHTNFNRAYFTRTETELTEVNQILRKFWEIEETSYHDIATMNAEDNLAVNKVTNSLKYQNGCYQVAIPWKEDPSNLPSNYDMALKCLKNHGETIG